MTNYVHIFQEDGSSHHEVHAVPAGDCAYRYALDLAQRAERAGRIECYTINDRDRDRRWSAEALIAAIRLL